VSFLILHNELTDPCRKYFPLATQAETTGDSKAGDAATEAAVAATAETTEAAKGEAATGEASSSAVPSKPTIDTTAPEPVPKSLEHLTEPASAAASSPIEPGAKKIKLAADSPTVAEAEAEVSTPASEDWVKIDGSTIPKKPTVEDAEDE
jgi:hypothetical protein